VIAVSSQDLTTWWAPALAFVAGAVSFASPCVFPLVPGYLSFVTAGRAVDGADAADGRGRHPLAPILLFILGFATVFTLLGASASWIARLQGPVGRVVVGGFVVLMGVLMLAYALRRGGMAVFAERRPFLQKVRPGTAGALPLGMAFAAGWTPCVGPVLGAILGLARTGSGDAARGAFLLFLYSMGLGVPFLLIGLGVERFMGAFGWVKRNYRWIAGVSGVLLVVLGVLIAANVWTRLIAPLQRFTPGL
jgi:cytochrome c-type biogenesis protein